MQSGFEIQIVREGRVISIRNNYARLLLQRVRDAKTEGRIPRDFPLTPPSPPTMRFRVCPLVDIRNNRPAIISIGSTVGTWYRLGVT